MNPGMTIIPDASIVSASAATRSGPTSTIAPPSIRTSAVAKSPTCGSIVRTVPPRSRILPVGATAKSTPVGYISGISATFGGRLPTIRRRARL